MPKTARVKTEHSGANEERHELMRKLRRARKEADECGQDYTVVVLDTIIGFVKERVARNKAKKGGL